MSADILSARPPNAAIAWATPNGLYIEYATPSGEPYICRLPLTIDGLTTGLNILVERPAPSAPRKDQSSHPQVKKAAPTSKYSPEERSAARAVLRRLNLISGA